MVQVGQEAPEFALEGVLGKDFVDLADDAFFFLIAWEMMAAASYFLVLFEDERIENRRAAFLYLVVAHVGAIAILLSFGVMAGLATGFSGFESYTFDAMRETELPAGLATLAFFLAFFGFAAKAGVQRLNALNPQWRVVLVGSALPQTQDYADRVMRAHSELGLENVAVFAGARPDAIGIVKRSAVLFSTSVHEGCPNVVLEAMAVGTPVVSTAYSDITLMLPNDWQVVRSRDASELAGAIVRADHERERVSGQQRRWLDDNATLTQSVTRLEMVYLHYAAFRGRAVAMAP